jgi:hypothetical protein
MFLVAKTIYNCKKITVEHVFHIFSIILTVTFLAYKPGIDGTAFVKVVAVLRSFRLLFPIFFMHNFFYVFSILGIFLNKVKKIVFAIFILLTIMSLITFQMYSSALHNQCRDSDLPNSSSWMTIG